MKLKKLKKKVVLKAFTLMECLVALLAISGSVLIFQGLTKLMYTENRQVVQDNVYDWQIFCNLMRFELDNSNFVKVENNFIYVTQADKQIRFGLPSKAKDFRRTDYDGKGYQPMIFGIKTSKITEENQIIKISLTFDDKGEERTFYYKFLKPLKEKTAGQVS